MQGRARFFAVAQKIPDFASKIRHCFARARRLSAHKARPAHSISTADRCATCENREVAFPISKTDAIDEHEVRGVIIRAAGHKGAPNG